MAKYPDQTRNLNPIPEAVIARCLWGNAYAAQSGGTMDFWDGLSAREKQLCKDILDDVLRAAKKHGKQVHMTVAPTPQEQEEA